MSYGQPRKRSVRRRSFRAGQQGQHLVIDPRNPDGVSWQNQAPREPRGHLSASQSITVAKTHAGLTGNVITWHAGLTGWTQDVNSNWTASGTGFTYDGPYPEGKASRVFRVSWQFHFQWSNAGVQGCSMLGRMTRDTGSGAVAIPGSESMTSRYGQLLYFGIYFHSAPASASALVSVSDGDVVAFQYGSYGAVTYAVNGLLSAPTVSPVAIGIQIDPADVVP